jgi:NADH:ubiquinone oxidoreductase subunit 5 (subunit L)/multisubunit Na+/H+ antiporter MnhA subunit
MFRNIVTVIVSAFTLCNVFSDSLMILQFATIFFAFQLSHKILPNENNEIDKSQVLFKREEDRELEHKEPLFSVLSIMVIIVVIILGIIISQYTKK